MNSAEILSRTDRTSWRRMWMVARYFWPRFRSKVIIFPLVTLLIFTCGHLVGKHVNPMGAYAIFGLINYLLIFNPLIFTKRSDMEITATLPATGLEKCVAVLGYSFVLMPLVIDVPLYLAYLLTDTPIHPDSSVLVNDVAVSSPLITACNVASTLAMIASCLWAVMAARTHRVIKGVAAALGVSVFIGMISAVYGFVAAIMESGHAAGVGPEQINGIMSRVFTVTLPLLSVYLIFALAMTCRAIRRRQL
ncbi:MAG: hypothetical protein K2M97_02820 [Muribaculaceae bacterium]|nr:hypothetical protein [Muribaculaceae bacterium]